jgi:hypothetical protein
MEVINLDHMLFQTCLAALHCPQLVSILESCSIYRKFKHKTELLSFTLSLGSISAGDVTHLCECHSYITSILSLSYN